MSRKSRRQRVTLRFRRREQLKTHVRSALVRSAAIALVLGFGAGLVVNRNSVLLKFLKQYTPKMSLVVPEALVGLPVLSQLPANHLWLWVPGSEWWLERKLKREYVAVRSVFFERRFMSDAIVVHVMPRVALATWNGQGFDRDGVLFNITPGTWKVLPQVHFLANASKPELGRWLARLEAVPGLWGQIASFQQDAYGTIDVTLKTGSVVIWGAPESGSLARKAQTLARVLDDAHAHLGGTTRADLRFFDQGRIIVMPKSARG